MPGSDGMIKEVYITQENIVSKTQQWMDQLKPYSTKGASLEYSPSSSALLITDMQLFFLSQDSHAFIPSSNAIVPKVKNLINAFRRAKLPVIFTRHSLKDNEEPGIMGRWWGDVIREADTLSEIVPSLEPLDSEVVIRKTRYSAFHGTELEKVLKQSNAKSVVITGVMTHLCCETTARDAFMRDYEVFFVVDGTATQNDELHISSLRTLSHGFCVPITTEEILVRIKEMLP